MGPPRVFFEVRELAELSQRRAGERTLRRTSERGYAVETAREGDLDARWSTVAQETDLEPLPAEVRGVAQQALLAVQPIAVEPLEDALNTLSAHAQALGAQLQLGLRETEQRVVCAVGSTARADHRRDLVLELKLTVTREGKSASLQRERAYLNGEAFTAAGPALRTLLEEMQGLATRRLEAVAAPSGPLTIVLPPGSDAGVFFHEVCGHPLEGDVVARGASYLAQRLGQRVAEPFVEVRDDPTLGAGVSFTLDDEGTPASPARLITGGEVRDALLDSSAAAQLGRAPNGHARRVSFRHPALPRMSHTLLAPHQGTFEELVRGVSRGLLVRALTPRHVNLLSGDFSFFIVEGQLIEDGQVGPFVTPCLLRGNGLTALAGIEAVGADLAAFHGLKGCGKLDHGPLPVSFGNPTVRISGLTVDAWS